MNEEKLKKILSTDLVALKALRFFSENPSSVDSARGIAAWVSSGRADAERALSELVDAGALELDSSGRLKGFSLPKSEDTRKIIKNLVDNA